MELNEQVRPKKAYDVIEPNTTRVIEMKRQKALKDLQKRTLEEKQRRLKEEQQRKNASLMRMRQDEKRLELKRRQEEERRKREEENQSNTLTGQFGNMINDLNTNTTNLQFTTAGMDLRPAQIKVLISNVQNNSSLKGLTMCRKRLTDVQGFEVAQKLLSNIYLEKLQLEGNMLGPESLYNFSKLLAQNETLRSLDLEGNPLIRGPQDKVNYKGIDALAEALCTNDTLVSLNLSNTGLDGASSRKLRQMMEQNSALILLDTSGNPEMNIEDVIAIQDALLKNKQSYDDERYMEFIERKRMRREEDISGVLQLDQQTKKLRGEAIDLNIKTKKAHFDEEWSQFLASQQLKKQKEIVRMEKEAAGTKKKKKKK